MEVSPSFNEEPHRPAVEFTCARCGTVVQICRSCWRNQKYCSKTCSDEAYTERHRRDQKAYRQTPGGRATHKANQKVYRAQKKIFRD